MSVQVYENHNHLQHGHFDEEQVKIIKDTICRGATNEELAFFLQVCKRTGLDPFSRQIYSVPRGNQRTIQVGIDGLCLLADRTGRYMPGKESSFSIDKNGNLYSCTAYIKKQAKDGSWHEVSAIAFWDEYNAGQGLWKKMPRRMLEKCALALCLRKAFPADLSGLYTDVEMDQADVKPLYKDQANETVTDWQPPKLEEQVVTKEQAQELKDLHDRCEADYRESVLNSLVQAKIKGWGKVPASDYNTLKEAAIANIEQYQKAVEAEMANVEE